LNPFGIERPRLVTRLSPEECRDRLSALLATQKDQWRILGGPPPGRPLTGTVAEDRFSVARFTPGRQSFKTFASGRLVPTPHGTEVTIGLGVHPIVLGFLAVFTLLVLSAVLVGLVGIAQGKANQPLESLPPPLLFMLAGLPAMVGIGLYMARHDGAYLLGVLRDALEAEPPAPSDVR
jgi:hypothetical protein